jgi:uncharacterized protein YlzI (FlbEa/FlbD family)
MLVGFDHVTASGKRIHLNPASVESVHDDAGMAGAATVILAGERKVVVKGNADAVARAINEALRGA